MRASLRHTFAATANADPSSTSASDTAAETLMFSLPVGNSYRR